MPFPVGSVAVHDDGQHTGSAKRNVANGVVGLNAGADIIAPGNELFLNRDGSGDIFIAELTSGEPGLTLRRTGANTFTLYNNTVAAGKIVQDSSMKDVASGIAGLNAAAKVPDANLESPVGTHAASSPSGTIHPSALRYRGYAGENILHTNNAQVDSQGIAYAKRKQITLTKTPSATLRIQFGLGSSHAVNMYGKIYRNGIAVGTERVQNGIDAWTTFSEDIAGWANGDTLELWSYTSNAATTVRVKNFQIMGILSSDDIVSDY